MNRIVLLGNLVLLLFINSADLLSQHRDTELNNWFESGKPHLKIGVAADGIYRVSYEDLLQYGFNITATDPHNLILFKSGFKIPIFVSGKEDGRFDPEDFIEFVGLRNMGGSHHKINDSQKPYNEYLGRYTDTTVYWLSWRENDNSVIENATLNNSTADTVLTSYYETLHYERNVALDFSSPDLVTKDFPFWTGNKTWIESLLNPGTKNYNFAVKNLVPGKNAFVSCKLFDYASDFQSNSHLLAIGLNSSSLLDSTSLDRYEQAVLNAEIGPAFIQEGNNTVKIRSFPTSASLNVCAIDWVELKYPKLLSIDDGLLKFSFLSPLNNKLCEIRISGIISEINSIWKYGTKIRRYLPPVNGNMISIIDTVSNTDLFFISGEDRIKKPKYYYSRNQLSLMSDTASTEYLIITHKKFLNKAREYGDFISSSYSLRSRTVDIEDIYDEFSYGLFNPESVRDFLKFLSDFRHNPKLKYLLLIGGATYDYHGNKAAYQGAPRFYNYVPSFGSPVSDTWFVIFDSSNTVIPDISIGRLPVTTNEELDWYYQKHKEYLDQPFDAWNKRVIFFSGGTGNVQSQIDALKNINDFIIKNYVTPKPFAGIFTHFYKTINPVNNFGPYTPEKISNVIDSGGVFISYLGHSGTQTWDNSITDPMQLQNKVDRYPLITDFGCSTSRFAEPDVISFSQTFVNRGQAIAYIANSSLGFTSTSYTFPQIFYKKLLADSVHTIGDAHRIAKMELVAKYGSSGVYQLFALTNTLIGDPVISLKFPSKPNLKISQSDIRILDNNFSDSQDSLRIKISISNYGLSNDASYKILIQDHYNSSLNYSKDFRRIIPDYEDSIFFKIPVKDMNGEHRISVSLDTEGAVNEIYENDNIAYFDFILPSGSVKYLISSNAENYVKNPLRILSPTASNTTSSYVLQVADNRKFINPVDYSIMLDTIKTDFFLDNIFRNKRLWLRAKSYTDDSSSTAITFKLSDKNSFSLFDSLSFLNQYVKNMTVGDALTLDSNYVRFRLLSAGLNDGNTALILKDGQNFIPENTLRGHHVAVFKGSSFKYADYKRFDLYGGGAAVTNEYIKFLDTLSSDCIVAFTVSDEGTVSSAALRNKIKEYGSKYIDNVSFRSSWVMLGRKGAATGTVPEKYSKQYQGRVEADTVILSDYRSGELLTNIIGPAAKWEKLNLGLSGTTNLLNLAVLGNGLTNYDTLFTTADRKTTYDLSSIDHVKYPYLKVILKLSSENINDIVKIDSLIIDYRKPPELVISNYTSYVSSDTLTQGETVSLNYTIYNVGETTAQKVKVVLQLFKSDGVKISENVITVDSIITDNRRNYSFSYNTGSLSGSFYIIINADPDRSLNEIYTDNNYLSVPFFVRGDESIPVVQVKFDDADIYDGDYISSSPDIRISINNGSLMPLSDTSSVEIYLNNQRIYFNNNADIINYSFSSTNPKMIIDYKPFLEDGEYLFKVVARNPVNSSIERTTVQKKFLVFNESRLLHVYNYPNPFSDMTYFTFKLTRIPDQLKIRIYTLTGRLIKEISAESAQLKYDLNLIEWDGRDQDGSLVGNGVYIYKIVLKSGTEQITATQKLSVVR
ncbi:MAG TPA: C25 family cysteine peptidase [Melioribacteraceae bacterium]|nr:C25 family cysteine peptidase [Melioribacteraceae bacterium]